MSALLLALLFVAAPAGGKAPRKAAPASERTEPEDKEPPSIIHVPIPAARRDAEVRFEADIHDKSGVFAPLVYWRRVGQAEWSTLPLKGAGGDRFIAALPSFEVSADIEYFVEAYDAQGNGPVRFGSYEKPLRIVVEGVQAAEMAPGPAAPAAPAPAFAPPADDEGGELPLGPMLTAGGGVALAALGAALYLSASSEASTLVAKYPPGTAMRPQDHEAALSVESKARVGSILMIAGLVAGGGGAAWWALGPTLGGGGEVRVGGKF